MTKIFDIITGSWVALRKPVLVAIPVILILLFGLHLFSEPRIAGDTASHILLAVSPIIKIGSPYKDFWEIKPPAWPLTVYVWSSVFGFGILSIKILNIIFIGLIALFAYLIYKKVFPSPLLELFFLFAILINFSPLLNTLIFPTEILGLALSLSGLYLLLYSKKGFWRYYFSGVLFFLASQSKEPYTLTILSVIPLFLITLLQKKYVLLFKNIAQFVSGLISGLILLIIYLAGSGSLGSYLEVFKFKQLFFPFNTQRLVGNFSPAFTATNNTFIEYKSGILILFGISFFLFLIANKYKKTLIYNLKLQRLVTKPVIVMDNNNTAKYIVILYSIGSFLGLGLGGSFGSHYMIQMPIPFYLLYGLLVLFIFNKYDYLKEKGKIYLFVGFVAFAFSILLILPKKQYLKSYLPLGTDIILKDEKYGYEKRIAELTSKDQCVLSVYGWGVSENYLYSERKPCTRFFLPNIVRMDWQKSEYRESVIKNPPALIAYTANGADMDVSSFEREVINIGKIVKNCYIKDTQEDIIYLPKTSDKSELKKCINNNSK